MDQIYVTKALMPTYKDYINKIESLWNSARITNMGEMHKELERRLKEYLGVKELSLFTNGHMALELAIQSFNLQGEVITTPFTFVSTTHAIVRNNLTPVFCDINEKDYTIDVSKIESLITEKTVAIVPVHVYGHICDCEKIAAIARKYNLRVIYDAAHAFGVRKDGKSILNYGDASILSFHATKVFNTIEGGAVVYENSDIGEELYRLKNFGIRNEVTIDGIGSNAKMDEFRAAMGLCNLDIVEEAIKDRKQQYEQYLKNLSGLKGIRLSEVSSDIDYNYAYFPVYFEKEILGNNIRDNIYEYLKQHGIFSRRYFYPLTNDVKCYNDMYSSKYTPIAKKISEGILTLPLYPGLSLEDVDKICALIIQYLEKC